VRWFLKEKGTKPGAERVDLIKELMNLKGKSGRLKGPNGKFWGAERPASTAGRVQPRPLEHRNGLLAVRASTRERHGTLPLAKKNRYTQRVPATLKARTDASGLNCLIVRPYHALSISKFVCDLTEFWSLAFCVFLFFWTDRGTPWDESSSCSDETTVSGSVKKDLFFSIYIFFTQFLLFLFIFSTSFCFITLHELVFF
jgi:hypothetical protein